MTLDELLQALESNEEHWEQDTPVVVQQKVAYYKQGAVLAKELTLCYWNDKTGEILSIDDEDVGEGFVRALVLMVEW